MYCLICTLGTEMYMIKCAAAAFKQAMTSRVQLRTREINLFKVSSVGGCSRSELRRQLERAAVLTMQILQLK